MDLEEESDLIGIYKEPVDIVREYSMASWYDAISQYTFKSVQFSLTLPEIKALSSSIRSSWSTNHHVSDIDKESIRELERKINDHLNEFGGQGFVKLSTRSPKDAVFERNHPKVVQYLDTVFEGNGVLDDNMQLIELTRACNNAMMVTSAKEALDLLCKSERVFSDLKKANEIYESGETIDVIVREWREIPLKYEFRGFVCKNSLNALAQYFHFCYFDDLADEKDEIEAKILAFWESMNHEIPHENYVIDFAIIDGEAWVIEINPFHFSTGAPFFSWKRESEGREIILNGPFTFRIASEPMSDGKERYMSTVWHKYFERKLTTPKPKEEPGCSIQ